MKEKVLLAYSGGLDTSVAIKWLQEKYHYEVVAVAVDVGEGKDLSQVKAKALQVGAIKSIVVDAKYRFAHEFLVPALKANALYEGKYPLQSALSRPLISEILMDIAKAEGIKTIAHGCTGKGNDQVRFELAIKAIDPTMKVIAPVRDWGMSRDEEILYAQQKKIPIPIDLENPYSIDQNLWGRSCECGVLEDPWQSPPEDSFAWTQPLDQTPDEAVEIEIAFQKGIPTHLNKQEMPLVDMISRLNELAGQHGVGRIDHVENRLVGIKSREVYEAPGALTLIQAHRELEFLTQAREVAQFKPLIEQKWADLIYDGLWHSPLKKAFDQFIDETQKYVTGKVRLKLWKGHCTVTGRMSPYSLYHEALATYSTHDQFDHQAAAGFIELWGLSTKIYADVHQRKEPLNESVEW
ncbi:argininosuccinate synthase [Hazenella sp. IB182357]|uniref:Argininosuccinate synthase n=1 Tax=Polycladospora coralii TaxID=2771432 RepID=A0A926RXH6_9BACL|nr:argininosuccinate synthase [Polycladospora coralii]MBD1372526.1 argininosuccinate synthase [Polycladospora coralii]